jgi:class 3 adenylate cyclase
MVIFQSEEGPLRHALNTAHAAIAIQHRLAELNEDFTGVYPAIAMHVGINSGLVFVGATKLSAAGSERWTFTASGPTTNLAARIAGLAKGGADGRTHQKYFVLEDTGQHQLKHVSELVQVFRLVIPGHTPG